MVYPAGVVTRKVELSDPLTDFAGVPLSGLVTFIPSVSLKWVATGQLLTANPVQVFLTAGLASIILPIIQSGFVTSNDAAVDVWTYTASISTPAGGVAFADKTFVLPYGSDNYQLDMLVPSDILGTVLTTQGDTDVSVTYLNLLVLGPADPVPAGTAVNTVIVRKLT